MGAELYIGRSMSAVLGHNDAEVIYCPNNMTHFQFPTRHWQWIRNKFKPILKLFRTTKNSFLLQFRGEKEGQFNFCIVVLRLFCGNSSNHIFCFHIWNKNDNRISENIPWGLGKVVEISTGNCLVNYGMKPYKTSPGTKFSELFECHQESIRSHLISIKINFEGRLIGFRDIQFMIYKSQHQARLPCFGLR